MSIFGPLRFLGLAACGLNAPAIADLARSPHLTNLESLNLGCNDLQDAGVDPTPGQTPEKTADFIKTELAKWAPIIRASGAHVD